MGDRRIVCGDLRVIRSPSIMYILDTRQAPGDPSPYAADVRSDISIQADRSSESEYPATNTRWLPGGI
jgi:hypothetical protein